jgi:hypothetical protein
LSGGDPCANLYSVFKGHSDVILRGWSGDPRAPPIDGSRRGPNNYGGLEKQQAGTPKQDGQPWTT